MGALPKNKITRVERGKRRAGNTPKLLKDTNSRTPLHKQGFVAEFMKFIGMETASPAPTSRVEAKKEAKAAKKAAQSVVAPQRASKASGKTSAPKKVIRKSDRT